MNVVLSIRRKIADQHFLSGYPREFKPSFFAFVSVMNMGGLVWGVLALYFGFYRISLIPFLYIFFSILNVGYLLYSNHFATPRFLQVFNSILLPFLFQWLLGGFAPTGAVMLWSFMALVALLTFYKTEQTIPWLFFFLFLVLVSYFTDSYSYAIAPQELLQENIQRILFCVNIGMIGGMMFVLARYFISVTRAEKRINFLLNEQREQLMLKNAEIQEKNEEILAFSEEMRQQNEEILSINEDLEYQRKLIAAKNEDLLSSINYAKRIQNAILGDDQELYRQFGEIFIFFQPRDVVSGDFYWYAKMQMHGGLHAPISSTLKRPLNFNPGFLQESSFKDNSVKLLTVGDCTGHGVPAAFMTLLGLNLLEEIVYNQRLTDPAEILSQLDKELSLKLHTDEKNYGDEQIQDGMDIALIAIEESKNKITISSAKSSVLYIHHNVPVNIKGSLFSIGGHSFGMDKEFTNHEFYYHKGDQVFLFTDGFQDQFGGLQSKKFMKSKFRDLLCRISELEVNKQKAILSEEFSKWKGEHIQTDDVLVIGIKL